MTLFANSLTARKGQCHDCGNVLDHEELHRIETEDRKVYLCSPCIELQAKAVPDKAIPADMEHEELYDYPLPTR